MNSCKPQMKSLLNSIAGKYDLTSRHGHGILLCVVVVFDDVREPTLSCLHFFALASHCRSCLLAFCGVQITFNRHTFATGGPRWTSRAVTAEVDDAPKLIPKVIHQTYKSSSIPNSLKPFMHSWRCPPFPPDYGVLCLSKSFKPFSAVSGIQESMSSVSSLTWLV